VARRWRRANIICCLRGVGTRMCLSGNLSVIPISLQRDNGWRAANLNGICLYFGNAGHAGLPQARQ